MAYDLEELRQLPLGQLITEHDKIAQSTQIGINYYLNEIARRDLDEQTRKMLRYSNQVKWMTVIITGATVINVVIAAFLVFK